MTQIPIRSAALIRASLSHSTMHRPWLGTTTTGCRSTSLIRTDRSTRFSTPTAVDVPDRPATSFFGATLTFAEIKDRSDRLAAALGAARRSPRATASASCCPTARSTSSRRSPILRHGAVIVNINPSYTAREVLTVATDSGIRILITLDALAPLALAVKDAHRDRAHHHHLARRVLGTGADRAPRVAGTDRSPILGDARAGRVPRGDRARRSRGAAVHGRHHRHAEGRDADAPQHLRERRADRGVHVSQRDARRGAVPARHSVLSHLRVHRRDDDGRSGSAPCRS